MKRTSILILICFLILVGAGCAGRPAVPPVFSLAEKAIQVNLTADPKLNWHEGRPHTLMLCFYQMRNPNGFEQLKSRTDGLYKLLECRTDDPSMISANRVFVQPRDTILLNYDRAEGTRYLGVIAGYYDMRSQNIIRLKKVPVEIKNRVFFMPWTRTAAPDVLNMELQLGPYGIISP